MGRNMGNPLMCEFTMKRRYYSGRNADQRGRRPARSGKLFAQLNLHIVLVVATVLIAPASLFGQNPQLRTSNGRSFPTLVFTSVFWAANPSYYSIAIDSTGTATYQSAPETLERTGVPYTVEFHVSDRTRRAVFNLARDLNFLRDPVAVSAGSPQETSVRTLAYADPAFRNQITYSSSSDPNIEEITSILEEISETLEFGRRLSYSYEHDRNALESELKSAQSRLERHRTRELHSLAPALSRVVGDPTLKEEVRRQANVLLGHAQAER